MKRAPWMLVGLLMISSVAVAQPTSPVKDDSDKLFGSGEVLRLKIEIPPEEVERIRAEHRPYVRGIVVENDSVTYKSVGIKLKGAAGSFREFDDRPALTLNADKFNKKQVFHGLDKFHLNNSVQDETYLQELLCSELFRAAGCPTPRATHARVWLNGRDVGLYVLKEGFDAKFLKRHFAKSHGNLYDGGFLQDVDANLEKDAGVGPDDHSDLHALAEACRDPDPKQRWERIAQLVDMEAFITFMALERMTCHWDGYALNMNNYRLYFDPAKSQAIFMAHGMDQMFGDPGMSLFEHPHPLVSSAVMQNNVWRKRYRERIHELLSLFSPPDKLLRRVEDVTKRLQPVLVEMSADTASAHLERVKELKERIVARVENLKAQDAEPDPELQEFDAKGVAKLPDWYRASEVEDAKLEEVDLPGKKKAYSASVGPSGQCVASWRRRVLLGPGTYQFIARCQTKGVVPLDEGNGSAAGIRISHGERYTKLAGTSAWKPLEFEFTVLEDRREVELVAELRAKKGQALFEVDSLRLVRKTN